MMPVLLNSDSFVALPHVVMHPWWLLLLSGVLPVGFC